MEYKYLGLDQSYNHVSCLAPWFPRAIFFSVKGNMKNEVPSSAQCVYTGPTISSLCEQKENDDMLDNNEGNGYTRTEDGPKG